MNEQVQISIDNVRNTFEKHLALEYNERIVFSGKFGTGKTFFLRDFFKSVDGYSAIFISPLNYSTSSNEDIFDLIKVDILTQFLTSNIIDINSGVEIEKWIDKLYLFGQSSEKVISFLLTMYPAVSSELQDGYFDKLHLLATQLLSIKEKINIHYEKSKSSNITNDEKIIKFLDSYLTKKGSPYEYDFVTSFINFILDKNFDHYKTVLVIDDLDRLDPDHIFRILNILSVHNNALAESNKFKFNKIILVFDIRNIKHIFFHRYGDKVDFDGYMNKFYSTEIYHFNNRDALVSFLSSGVFENFSDDAELLLRMILLDFLESDLITLRQIIKYHFAAIYSIKEYTLAEKNFRGKEIKMFGGVFINRKVDNMILDLCEVEFFSLYKYFTIICGGKNNFYEYMYEIEKKVGYGALDSQTFFSLLKPLVVPYHYLADINNQGLFDFKYHNFTEILHGNISSCNYKILFTPEMRENNCYLVAINPELKFSAGGINNSERTYNTVIRLFNGMLKSKRLSNLLYLVET